MRRLGEVAIFILLAASIAGGQQTSPSMPAVLANPQTAQVKVYVVGPDVTAPELLPLNLTPFSAEKCKKKVDGKVVFSVIVDTAGRPRNIMFLQPLGTELDRFAVRIAAADRFNPGMKDGKPVFVAESVEVGMQSCMLESKDSAGKEAYSLRLRSVPEQKFGSLPQPPEEAVLTSGDPSWEISSSGEIHTEHVGGGVSAPVPLNSVEAHFTDAARRAKYQGTCLISLIVDRNGLPQNTRVLKTLDYGLDQNATAAVSRYRFKPAMKNGEPVPVMITVEVNFKLY